MDIHAFDETLEYRKENFRIKQLVSNETDKHYPLIQAHLQQSDQPADFSARILRDGRLTSSELFRQIFRHSSSQWEWAHQYLLDALPNKRYTSADVGGLLIGTENFAVRLPNGMGDGEIVYDVIDGRFDVRLLDYVATISGDAIPIYASDLMEFNHNEIVETLSGKFMVYSYDGIVIFKRY